MASQDTNSNDEPSGEAQCDCNSDEYHVTTSSGFSNGNSFAVKKCLKCGVEGRVRVTDDGREWFGALYNGSD